MEIDLGPVQETQLLTLVARAKETTFRKPLLNDRQSKIIYDKIEKVASPIYKKVSEAEVHSICQRAWQIDLVITQFLEKHPNGKILDIGAGLDTTFYRCDNGKAEWYDLDLPDSMELRNKLIPIENRRVHYIGKSMFDYSWINEIGPIDNGLLITVPGVFMYFEKEDVKKFLKEISSRLKGAEILFDVLSPLGKVYINFVLSKINMGQATLKWTSSNPAEPESWSSNLKLIRNIRYFESIPDTKHFRSWLSLRFVRRVNMSQLFHYKFV